MITWQAHVVSISYRGGSVVVGLFFDPQSEEELDKIRRWALDHQVGRSPVIVLHGLYPEVENVADPGKTVSPES